MSTKPAWSILLLLALGFACSSPPPATPSFPPPPAVSSALDLEPRGFTVEHYDLAIALEADGKQLTGDAGIDVVVTDPSGVDQLVFDFVGFDVLSATVDGSTVAHDRGAGGPDDDRMRLHSAHLAPATKHRARIRYSGQPSLRRNNGGRYDIILGFQGFTNDMLPEVTHYTQNQPDGARLWFPCVDHPSVKATLRTVIDVPEPLSALSNGRLADGSPEPIVRNGTPYRRFTWISDQPIATYLVHISAGVLANDSYTIAGIEIDNHFPTALDPGAIRRALVYEEAAIPLYLELYGPFPFEHYGHVFISDGQPMTAMENQTVTLMDASLLEEAHHEILELTAVHELAHSWMGDDVTPIDHHHYWFSEGLATFSELIYLERTSTDFARATRATGAWRDTRRAYWKRYRNDGWVLGQPDIEILGAMAYIKGGLIFSMLRYSIGEDALFRGLRQLVHDHAYANVGAPDIRAAMEEASGRDLGWFFDQWVENLGFPVIRYGCRARRVPGFTKVQVDCTFAQVQSDYPKLREHWADIIDAIPLQAFPLYQVAVPIWLERPTDFSRPSWIATLEAKTVQTVSTCADDWPVAIGVDPFRVTYGEWVPGLEVEDVPYICTD